MERHIATRALRDELDKHGLSDWSVRLNQNAEGRFLGLCSYKDKCIILNAHHIDIHPEPDVINTIKHEVAHALTQGHGHDEIWAAKAREIGCDNTSPCSNLSLSPDIIDAIRSGATVEVEFDTEVIRKPRYTITRLQDKCEICGKVAKTKSEQTVKTPEKLPHDLKFIHLECGHVITKKIPKGTAFWSFQMGGEEDCKHEWDKNKCLKCGRFRPYDFQLEGMKFLEAALSVAKGGAVLDEMGLGKTIQAGGVIKFHPELWPVLWIVKSGLKYQFSKFLILWLGDDHVPQIIERSNDFLIPGLKHYIIGYDMLVHKERKLKSGKVAKQGFDIAKFEKLGIKCVVLDECQQIKNPDSSRTQQVRKICKNLKVITLSGTPWKNRGSELFPMFNMLDPIKFPSNEAFKRDWVDTYWEGNRLKEGGIRNPAKFREHVKDIAIRREREEVMKELPTVNRTKLYVKLEGDEEAVYDEAVQQFVDWWNQAVIGGEEMTGMNILAKMARMRHLIGLAKIPATVDFVEEFVEDTDKKIVIGVHHQDVGEILFGQLHERFGSEMPVMKLTGGLDSETRFNIQEKFNNSPRAILVASTLAAGEGLNLQTCADCVLHERQWNPANEEQLEGRFIRIGQTSTSVNATYTEAEGSIDWSLDTIIETKRKHFHNTMNKGLAPTWNQNSLARELAESIVRSHNAKKKGNVLSFKKEA